MACQTLCKRSPWIGFAILAKRSLHARGRCPQQACLLPLVPCANRSIPARAVASCALSGELVSVSASVSGAQAWIGAARRSGRGQMAALQTDKVMLSACP